MHEVGIASAIVEKAVEVSRAHGDLPVTRVTLRIGKMQQIVPESLAFAFEAVSKGTPVEGATLDPQYVSLRVACTGCGREYEPPDLFWVCPACGERGGRLIEGDELLLMSVELEDSP